MFFGVPSLLSLYLYQRSKIQQQARYSSINGRCSRGLNVEFSRVFTLRTTERLMLQNMLEYEVFLSGSFMIYNP